MLADREGWAANRKVPDRNDVRAWYETYFDVLMNIGWAVEKRGFSEYRQTGQLFRGAHGNPGRGRRPAWAGHDRVRATGIHTELHEENVGRPLDDDLSQGEPKGPADWAFSSFGSAEPRSNTGPRLTLMSFELDADSLLTQVLFFKFRSADVTLRHASGAFTINEGLLLNVHPQIAKRVAGVISRCSSTPCQSNIWTALLWRPACRPVDPWLLLRSSRQSLPGRLRHWTFERIEDTTVERIGGCGRRHIEARFESRFRRQPCGGR